MQVASIASSGSRVSAVLRTNDTFEFEKAVRYNELVANAVMRQNVADQTQVVRDLIREGHSVRREDIAHLSPYATSHLKRFGRYDPCASEAVTLALKEMSRTVPSRQT